jgi:phage major head subunit gpT-like protein
MLINASNIRSAFVGFNAAFKRGLQADIPSEWQRMAMAVTSTGEAEDYGWIESIPSLKEWIGPREVSNLAVSDYTLKNKTYANAVAIPRPKFEDDKYGLFNTPMEDMGYTARVWQDQMLATLIAASQTALCYDGLPFFSASHVVNGATVGNFGSGSGNLWMLLDTRRPMKPFIMQSREKPVLTQKTAADDETVFNTDEFVFGTRARGNVGFGFWQLAYGSEDDLDATNYAAGVAAMQALTDSNGKPLGIRPNLLVVGASNRVPAKTLIEKANLSGGESNIYFQDVEVLYSNYLA